MSTKQDYGGMCQYTEGSGKGPIFHHIVTFWISSYCIHRKICAGAQISPAPNPSTSSIQLLAKARLNMICLRCLKRPPSRKYSQSFCDISC